MKEMPSHVSELHYDILPLLGMIQGIHIRTGHSRTEPLWM